ncbi:MAG: hypothetical protein DRN29_09575 [Thermoplasmata archaeon]|nr:MAG: hypothetical protein DRN29_09575 [Thermoplasmata archaeon]
MKVLVTGASGFIGRYLLNELMEHGYEVRALTRKAIKVEGVEAMKGDITKPSTLQKAFQGVDAVFHNAAYAADYGERIKFYEVNVEGTRNVAEACKKNRVERIIYTGSAGVYGFPNTNEWITEDSPKKPINAYQESKLEAEKVLNEYEDMHISIVRPPLVLGAGAKAAFMLLSKMEEGKLAYIGNGKNYITIAHPKDVALCLRLALEKDEKGEIFNVVSFICRIEELYKEIAKQLGVEEPKKHVPYFLAYLVAFLSEKFAKEPSLTKFRVKSFGTTRRISCEKAKKKLGYKPGYDLKATVKDMVEWYKGIKEEGQRASF